MTIRLIAKDLYKAEQKVSRLEKEVEQANLNEKTALQTELKMATKERDMIRKMLDGEKESASTRKRFDGFGSCR